MNLSIICKKVSYRKYNKVLVMKTFKKKSQKVKKMYLSTILLKLMNSNYNNYKTKVTNKPCLTQIQAISIFLVKIKLKVMIINLVAVSLKNNFQINKITVSKLN